MVKAQVVALDQPFMWNRLGTAMPSGMMYALRSDVVPAEVDQAGGGQIKTLPKLSIGC